MYEYYENSSSALECTELHMKLKIRLSQTTSDFKFQGNDLFLSFENYSSNAVRLLLGKRQPNGYGQSGSGAFSGQFVVIVQVKSAVTGQILSTLTSSTTIQRGNGSSVSVWESSREKMVQVSSEFKTNLNVTFIVVLKRSESDSTLSTPSQTGGTISNDSCLKNLSESFSKLLEEGLNTDMEFQCGGQSTKAHATVVSARSKVIASMLASNMIEGKTKVIKVQDMKPDIFKQFLRYLYTGKLDKLSFKVALSLYEAGDQYEVLSLAKRCGEFLMQNLAVQNACDALVIADAHSDESFVEKVVDFMVHSRVPLDSKEWPAFCDKHPKLANKVLNRGWKVLFNNFPLDIS